MRYLPLLLSLAMVCTAQAGDVRFADVTQAAGVAYLQHSLNPRGSCLFREGRECESERLTGGAGVTDINGDGWPDLLLTRLDDPPVLLLNRRDGTFLDVSAQHGLNAIDVPTNGVAFFDFDKDGDEDLYLTTLTNLEFILLRLDADGRFRRVDGPHAIASAEPHAGTSVSVGDYDKDGWPDLYVNEWRVSNEGPYHARLLHNTEGAFEDTTNEAGVNMDAFQDGGIFNFSSSFADMDADGIPDLTVIADFGGSKLFWGIGDGTFVDGTRAAGVGTDRNGMGATIGDIDNDGDLDLFVTAINDPNNSCEWGGCNWENSANRLYLNNGDRTFIEAAEDYGVGVGGWGWGTAMVDLNSDGWLDLVMASGFSLPGTDWEDPFNDDPPVLWLSQHGMPMIDVAEEAGILEARNGRGVLIFDYDLDGDLDLLITINGGNPVLFRNDTEPRSTLRIALRGVASTPTGYGARITVTSAGATQLRVMGNSSLYTTQSERVAHFGFGPLEEGPERVEVVVEWPSGVTWRSACQDTGPRVFTIEEPAEDYAVNCADGPAPGDAGVVLPPIDAGVEPALDAGVPDAAAVQPDAAAIQPDAAAVQPDAAAVQPDAAAIQPDAAAVQPDAAAIQPDAATIQPDAAAIQPDAAAVQPDAAAVQPDAAAVQPDAAAVQPDAAAVQPDAAAVQPDAAIQPDATVQPDAAASQPDADGESSRSTASSCAVQPGQNSWPPAILGLLLLGLLKSLLIYSRRIAPRAS